MYSIKCLLGRSTSWRGEGDGDEKSGLSERSGRGSSWNDNTRVPSGRKSWDTDDHLPEWATENPTDGGGSFDDKGAFHGSDDELVILYKQKNALIELM